APHVCAFTIEAFDCGSKFDAQQWRCVAKTLGGEKTELGRVPTADEVFKERVELRNGAVAIRDG
ncbi:hypothetical protein ACO1NJ_14875, partial [Staphylococcus aureus]